MGWIHLASTDREFLQGKLMAVKMILQAENGSVLRFACPGCHGWLWHPKVPGLVWGISMRSGFLA